MKTTSTILGISPGTRLTGLALLRDGELVDWKVKSFKGHWTTSKLKDILYCIQTYIKKNEVISVVIKKPNVFRSSTGLEQMISELRILLERMGVPMILLSLRTMKAQYSTNKGFTKAQMLKEAVQPFPELYTEFNKEVKSKNGYYVRMFEAFILAKWKTN